MTNEKEKSQLQVIPSGRRAGKKYLLEIYETFKWAGKSHDKAVDKVLEYIEKHKSSFSREAINDFKKIKYKNWYPLKH